MQLTPDDLATLVTLMVVQEATMVCQTRGVNYGTKIATHFFNQEGREVALFFHDLYERQGLTVFTHPRSWAAVIKERYQVSSWYPGISHNTW